MTVTSVPDTSPAPDYATRRPEWARQMSNAADATLSAQLKEIAADRLAGEITAGDLRELTALACHTYANTLAHPLVVSSGVGGGA